MPHELLNERQVAKYLHMEVEEVHKLALCGDIPARKVGDRYQFVKTDIDHWAEARMHKMGRARLADIERGVSSHHGFDSGGLVICPLIPPGGIAVPFLAKTRDSAIRDLVALADVADLVWDRDGLITAIREREEMCSTSFPGGVAFPHPRHPMPNTIASSFVVVGLSPSGVPFGAEDGSLARLFFLLCCKDDRTHLHVLARLGQMLHDEKASAGFMEAEDAGTLRELLVRREEVLVSGE
jgi:nitrogen PTS system EIIA component